MQIIWSGERRGQTWSCRRKQKPKEKAKELGWSRVLACNSPAVRYVYINERNETDDEEGDWEGEGEQEPDGQHVEQ